MNQNEFVQDGKRYVVNIKKCLCKEKNENTYVLECKIIQRGVHDYLYTPDSDFLQKRYSDKGFFLTESAKKTITEEINLMNEQIGETQLSETNDEEETLTVSYRNLSDDQYDFFVKLKRREDLFKYYKCEGLSLDEMIRELDFLCHLNHTENIDDLKVLEKHPIFQAAKKCNDEKMMLKMKILFSEETKQDCSLFTKLFGHRVLPTLSAEYDRPYIVNSSTVDCKLLHRSGYTVLHRPYFAMKNSTHSKWQLNPHTKCGVDAALNEDLSISFQEYLELFEENK